MMNMLSDITDKEFVPFLRSLGVETYNKSFEWMLNDADFAGVLRWMYENLDHNNALTAREQFRYAELEKQGLLLSPEELESTVASIQKEHPGICLPGDKEALEDVKFDISMQKERLNVLEKQERFIKDLVQQNELFKEDLNIEVTKLNAVLQQCAEDENTAAEECLSLANEVENLTDDVIDVIAGTLDLYGNCHLDKEIAKKFLTFGSLDSYRQTQALFRSHFDLFTARKFNKTQNDATMDDLRKALLEARTMEERLSEAVSEYIDSKAELSGEQAKLALVANYTNVHPSKVTMYSMEARAALHLMEQEESILNQQIQDAVKDLVLSRTRLAEEATNTAALAMREPILADLSLLLDTSQQALALDRLLYCALRYELRAVEEFVQFAAQCRQYVAGESEAVASRIDSMLEICAEQEACEAKLQSSDILTRTLSAILGVQPTNDASLLARLYDELLTKISELNADIKDDYKRKEEAIVVFKQSTRPLREYIWSGSCRQPNCWNSTVVALTRALTQEMEEVKCKVVSVGSQFTSVKNGDKQNLRKLWQFFVTEQATQPRS